MSKHLVYAEDVLAELLRYPDNFVYKFELKRLIEKVVKEKEVTINTTRSFFGGDWLDDGDIYD